MQDGNKGVDVIQKAIVAAKGVHGQAHAHHGQGDHWLRHAQRGRQPRCARRSPSCAYPGHIGRERLIALWNEGRSKRYEAHGSQGLTMQVGGSHVNAILKAVAAASACTDKPALIGIRTIIGYGTISWADDGNSQSAPPCSAAGHLGLGGS